MRGGGGGTASAPAAGELGRERIQPLLPEPVERLEPGIDRLERLRGDGVEATRAVRTNDREAAVAEHAEVLRDGGLRDAELLLDDRADRTRRQLALREQLEDASPDGVAEDVERVHGPTISAATY